MRLLPGIAHERGRRAVALPEAGTAIPGRRAVVRELTLGAEALLDLRDQVVGADALAGDVLAHVDDTGRPRLDREHRVEGRDAVDVCRRKGEPAAELVEAAGADPSDPLLERPECRQQQVAPRTGGVPRAGGVPARPTQTLTTVPAVDGRTEDGVERGALGARRLGARDEMQVH